PPRTTLFPYTTLFRSSRDRSEEAVQGRVLHSEGRRTGLVRRDGDSEGREEQGRRAAVDQLHRGSEGARGDHERRVLPERGPRRSDRKSTRLNSSHVAI